MLSGRKAERKGAAPIEKYLELVEAGGVGVGALGNAGEIILVQHVEQGALEAEARVLLEWGLKILPQVQVERAEGEVQNGFEGEIGVALRCIVPA